MVNFDWNVWAKNFPASAKYEATTELCPAGVTFTRAGQSVFLTLDELKDLSPQ